MDTVLTATAEADLEASVTLVVLDVTVPVDLVDHLLHSPSI